VRTQHVGNLPVLSTQPPDRFEDRQVRFNRPVLLQTLPATDPQAPSDAMRRLNVSISVVLPMPASENALSIRAFRIREALMSRVTAGWQAQR
jgi:hypothetical protein